MKDIHFGIIGPGKIARKFADDLRQVPHAKLHAVASTDLGRAQAFADHYQCPHAYGSYADMMACPGLDVVYIATPHVFHYENTMLALRHGKHVICEKPFAMELHQAEEMIATARANNLFLMEALWTMFIPAFDAAMRFIDGGGIGHIHSAKADFGFFSAYNPKSRLYNPELGGGSVLDIGLYPVLLLLRLFGPPPADGIQATAIRTRDGVDETCFFTFQYPDNRVGMGHSTVQGQTPIEATIFGTTGQVHLPTRFHHPYAYTVQEHPSGQPVEHAFPYEGWGYQFEAAHVVDCLQRGLMESPVVPHAFTMDLLRTLHGILAKV